MSLRYAILTLLTHQELSGYQLLDYFDGSVGFVWHATHQQIYRELEALDRDRLAVPRVVAQARRPAKKIYAITEQGREALLDWVATPAFGRQLKDEALLRAFSYSLIDRDIAVKRLGELRQAHEQRLAHYREVAGLLRKAPAHPFRTGSLLTLAAAQAFEEAYVRWCERAPELLERLEPRSHASTPRCGVDASRRTISPGRRRARAKPR